VPRHQARGDLAIAVERVRRIEHVLTGSTPAVGTDADPPLVVDAQAGGPEELIVRDIAAVALPTAEAEDVAERVRARLGGRAGDHGGTVGVEALDAFEETPGFDAIARVQTTSAPSGLTRFERIEVMAWLRDASVVRPTGAVGECCVESELGTAGTTLVLTIFVYRTADASCIDTAGAIGTAGLASKRGRILAAWVAILTTGPVDSEVSTRTTGVQRSRVGLHSRVRLHSCIFAGVVVQSVEEEATVQ